MAPHHLRDLALGEAGSSPEPDRIADERRDGDAQRARRKGAQAAWVRSHAQRNAAGALPQPRPADAPPPPAAEQPRGGYHARGPHGEPRSGDGRTPLDDGAPAWPLRPRRTVPPRP